MWEELITIIQLEDETKRKSWWCRLFRPKQKPVWQKDSINPRRWD